MTWIDEKYLDKIAHSLPMFKKVTNTLHNCRCVVCGDSTKNKFRARAYFLSASDGLIYYCHNCHVSLPFGKFLQEYYSYEYSSYVLEKFSSKKRHATSNVKFTDLVKPKKNSIFSTLESQNPIAIKYLRDRNIDRKFYYTPDFQNWVNTVIPNKFENPKPDPRIVIPLYGMNGEVYGFQGRTITNNNIKYITIVFDGCPKLFGLDTVDFNQDYYVLEGPLNSLFVDNAIASCGGKITAALEKVEHIKKNAVIIYDNDPRNKDVVANIKNAIDNDYRVVIWSKNIFEGEDINDIIKRKMGNNSMSLEDAKSYIKETIVNSTSRGLEAKLRLQQWTKI